MHIAIIGAASGVGYEATLQALKKGYKVTTLSTRESRLPLPEDKNLIKVKGSATNPKDVAKVMANTQAVLITIGTKQKKGTTLFSTMAKAVVQASEKLKYDKPIIVISGFGVGEGYRHANLFMKLVIRFFLKDQYKDKKRMEEIFKKSGAHWEMLQPGILSNGPLTSNYTVYTTFIPGMKVGKISRKDVAHFMLQEAKETMYIHKKVIATY